MMLESERYWTCNLCAKCEICIEYILEGQTLPQHISFFYFSVWSLKNAAYMKYDKLLRNYRATYICFCIRKDIFLYKRKLIFAWKERKWQGKFVCHG